MASLHVNKEPDATRKMLEKPSLRVPGIVMLANIDPRIGAGDMASEDRPQPMGQPPLCSIYLRYHAIEMPGIDLTFCSHKLSIDPRCRPISQRKRRVGSERQKVIEEQVKDLLYTEFI